MPDLPEQMLTPAEVAGLFKISRSMVYRLMDSGDLRSIHIGASRRIPASSLAAYTDRQLARAAR